jgi:capsular exopolysaccharide synthesis family protein
VTVIDFLRLTRRSWRALLLFVILGAAALVGYTATIPKSYSASSSGFIVAGDAGVVSGSTDAVNRISAYLPLISTTPVLQKIQENPDLDLGDQNLAGRLSANIVAGSTMIQVSATAPAPASALALANGGLKALTEVINEIETAGSPDQAASLKVVPLQNAALPSQPTNRDYKTHGALGALAGLLLGYLFVFLRRGFDTGVRSTEELTTAMGTGLLGTIPKVSKAAISLDSSDRESLLAAEAIRQVRTALSFSNVDRKIQCIAVTSANASEGKTTVATRLAQVVARSGREVVVIDADLRRPNVSAELGVDDTIGLSELLSGQAGFDDVIQAAAEDGLYVLPAGQTPPNPSEMLGSETFRTLVREVATDYFVIIDAPPVLPVTDASLIAATVDGVVFVALAGKTKKPAIATAQRMLNQVNAHVLGAVLNMVPLRGADSAAYGYYGKKYDSYAAGSKSSRKKRDKDRAHRRADAGR